MNLKKQIPASKAFIAILSTLLIPLIGCMILVINSLMSPISPPLIGISIQKEHSHFMEYEGVKDGEEISELLKKISTSNIQNKGNQIEVSSWLNNQKSSDNEFILNLIKEVDLESTYTVRFDYNNEGWITCINIEQN